VKALRIRTVFLLSLSSLSLLLATPGNAGAQECPCADLWNQATVLYEENFQGLNDTWLKCEEIEPGLFVAMDKGVNGGTIELLNTSGSYDSDHLSLTTMRILITNLQTETSPDYYSGNVDQQRPLLLTNPVTQIFHLLKTVLFQRLAGLNSYL
jgi:hypothetical protein